jgi:hypothetical protein
MDALEELKKWTDSLTVAEKRFIKLLGKARAGATASQQLELFDWLNRSQNAGVKSASPKFLKNLPTVSIRLKDLILDGLRLLHKENNIDALLRTTLDEIAILYKKKLNRTANKQLRRAKKLALDACRYAYALQCIEWEYKIMPAIATGNIPESLAELREEEQCLLKKLCDQRELQYIHSSLLTLMRQSLFSRDAKVTGEINALAGREVVHRLGKSGAYLERSLAVNISGLKNLNERKPGEALLRYRQLLQEWQTHPDWQNDQSSLLLLMCKFYQTSCFFSPLKWEDAEQSIAIVHEFKGLPPNEGRDFQRMLYHNQFTLSLNTGKFSSVKTLIPEIEQWLQREAAHLTEVQVLPFLCNFAVAEFLQENYMAANRILSRILNMPNRNARKDIRDFALILQAILKYELNDSGLNEYLVRAGKRRFSKNSFDINFELIVFNYLDKIIRIESLSAIRDSTNQLIRELDEFAVQIKDQIPVLGLNEVRMWAKAKQEEKFLTDIFLQTVKKNLVELEQIN